MRYHRLTVELIEGAGKAARELGHSYVGCVHLLLAMMQQRAGGYHPYGSYNASTQCDPCSAYLCLSCLTPWGGMCC